MRLAALPKNAPMPNILHIVDAPRVQMGNVFLRQPLPYKGIDAVDPFLLIHHWADTLPGGQHQKEVGVGPHPHRGFSPVTLVFKGGVHHRDTMGNDGVVYEGGTQWMNSGKGLVHSERPDKTVAKNGGEFELIQFWVNAPAAQKMGEPHYHALSEANTPWITSDSGRAKLGVVAGTVGETKGPVSPTSEMSILRGELAAGGTQKVHVPKGWNAAFYQLDGALTYDGSHETGERNMVVYDAAGGELVLTARADTRWIGLLGAPIGEPVATYGPFVMNTQREIMQALEDYQHGRMGQLIETF